MTVTLIQGDCRAALPTLPAESVQCCVTSPPYYGLRDYGVAGQIGLEQSPQEYVEELVAAFREVRRVLRADGTLWLNLGDSYAGSWGAQSRGGAPSDRSLLKGNGHVGGGPKIKSLSAVQIAQHPHKQSRTGSIPNGSGLKPKDLMMIPARVALALQADGWWLRSDIIWHKPNPMPESVRDRPTAAHEHVFLLTKSGRYFYNAEAIAEALTTDPKENYPARAKVTGRGRQSYATAHNGSPSQDKSGGFPPRRKSGNKARVYAADFGRPDDHLASGIPWEDTGVGRNARNVWTIATKPFPEAHFATFPPELAERCIKAGSRPGDIVLDPFGGAGTTGLAADRLGRHATLIELSPDYLTIARRRIYADAPLLTEVA